MVKLKFVAIILFILLLSFSLYLASEELRKSYSESVEKKNTEIYPFYELWAFIAIVIILILLISTLIHKAKNRKEKNI